MMAFQLPAVHDISIEMYGQTFEGSWYIVLGDMIVNFNGYTASIGPEPSSEKAKEVAVALLGELVEEHYVTLDAIPASLPEGIRRAAHRYVNASDEESATEDLVAAFGESDANSGAHKQLSWLCVNALSMIVPTWKHMCDGDAAQEFHQDYVRWLQNPSHVIDWTAVTTPAVALRDGQPVGDCDACRLEATRDAVASTARYLQSASLTDASAALRSAGIAYDEGCHSSEAPDRFEKWLVFDVLQASLRCEPLTGISQGPNS